MESGHCEVGSPGVPLYFLVDREKPAKGRVLDGQARASEFIAAKKPARVMILGQLRELALYRAEVLRHHGYEVLTPATEEDAVDIIRHKGIDVAVLSYTLPDAVVQRYAELIRQECDQCRLLAITQTMQQDRRIAPDSVVLADQGPQALVAALRKLVR